MPRLHGTWGTPGQVLGELAHAPVRDRSARHCASPDRRLTRPGEHSWSPQTPPHRNQTSPRPDHVILLVTNLHVRIVNAIPGELLRALILDPTRDYQP